jgi:putative protein-disulfide isomerase
MRMCSRALAVELGFDAEAFGAAFVSLFGRSDRAAHRRKPPAPAARGRPGLSDLRAVAGRWPRQPHRHRPWLGRAEDWKARLAELVGPSPAAAATATNAGATPPVCGPDGCAI